jgi:hypothetical protein
MNKISGGVSIFFGMLMFGIVLLQVGNLIMAFSANGGGQQIIVSVLVIFLFSIFGWRSISAGKLKWASANASSSGDNLPPIFSQMGSGQEKLGRDIADDCMVNGLRGGEIVKSEDITRHIHESYDYQPDAVDTGFLTRMAEYAQSGEVIQINVENGNFLFVHRDHLDQHFGSNQK